MNILMVVPEWPPYHLGGGGIFFRTLARQLLAGGDKVTVAYGYYPTSTFFEGPLAYNEDGIELLRLPLLPTPKSMPILKTVMPPNARAIAALWRTLSGSRFDVVHLNGLVFPLIDIAAIFCRVLQLRYVVTLQGFPRSPEKMHRAVRAFFDLYVRIFVQHTLRNARTITCVSRNTAATKVLDNHAGKVQVIYNCIDGRELAAARGRGFTPQDYGIPEDGEMLLSMARINYSKGLHTVIEALPQVLERQPDTFYVILGEDDGYYQALQDAIKALGLERHVFFPGFLDLDEKVWFMEKCTVFIVPSLWEPFGLVAAEAMSLGCPVISTKAGGLAEVVGDDAALLVEPGDAEAMAQAILAFLESEELGRAYGKKGQERARHFDVTEITEAYRDAFRVVAGG